MQGQAGDFPGGQHAALEGLWQQAAVVAQEDWQFRQQFAELQLGIRQLQLRRHAQSRVVVRCASVGVAWQQPGASTIRAAVELQAELADQLDAEAQGALGIAGLRL